MSDKTTLRPWVLLIRDEYGGWAEISAKGKEAIAEVACAQGQPFTEEDAANARLIVRAVNSHDALVAALKIALPHLAGQNWANKGNNPYTQARDALALAEAKP